MIIKDLSLDAPPPKKNTTKNKTKEGRKDPRRVLQVQRGWRPWPNREGQEKKKTKDETHTPKKKYNSFPDDSLSLSLC